MKSIFIATGLMVMSSLSVQALKIETTAGSLNNFASEITNTRDTRLELTGTANATDLKLLSRMSQYVETVDMTALEIVASDATGVSGLQKDRYEAGELPEFMLAGSRVKQIQFPRNLQNIGIGAFADSSLESVNLPATLGKVGDSAFAGCRSLQEVHIGSDVSLGKGVFKGCTSLKSVGFPNTIKEIPEATFDGCGNYTGSIPGSVQKIGAYSYRGTALEAVNLRSVTEIGDFAFALMPKLKELFVPSTLQIALGQGVFYGDKGLDVLPAINGDIPQLTLATTTGKSHYVIRSPKIGEAAYANNPNIDTITLGAEVREISRDAFRNLKSLVMVDAAPLKANVPEVDEEAFSGLLNPEGRYGIKLNVQRGTNETWSEHPVWGLFDVGQYETGVENLGAIAEDIIISRSGSTVTVTSDASLAYVGVFSLDGILLAQANPMQESVEITALPEDGVLVVKAIAGNLSKVVKLQ